ncbi:MAG: addiction module protein [Polyangiaceae bacterium]|nr:addiction module protein [Polyangiaceae bacterium]
MAQKERLMQEVLELSAEDRREIADTLLASLVPDDERSDDEWCAEIERRARRALAGEPGVPWSDARATLERRFGSF